MNQVDQIALQVIAIQAIEKKIENLNIKKRALVDLVAEEKKVKKMIVKVKAKAKVEARAKIKKLQNQDQNLV